MSQPPANAKWYDVPAGTPPAECRGENCRATIFFASTERGGKCPIDCDVDGGQWPSEQADPNQLGLLGASSEYHDGRGISHFFTCVDAPQFSKRGAR